MPRCPHCKKHFRVLEDEDDGQHSCPYCGYGEHPEQDEEQEEEERMLDEANDAVDERSGDIEQADPEEEV